MLSHDLLQQIKQIHISTSYLVNEAMAGEYASAFKGRGMEFEEVREYRPGDDIRAIDWKVTARTHRPYIKEYREERELTIFLMVDLSSSGLFGSEGKLKREAMAELAAILAYLASRNNDKVGMMLFTTDIEHFIPPKKGRGHVWRIIQEILTAQPKHRGTDLGRALDHAGRLLQKKTVLFLISDFLDAKYESALRLASKRHDITALRVFDPRERSLPNVGILHVEDAETGRFRLIDTSDKRTRDTYHKRSLQHEEKTRQILHQCAVDHVPISTTESLTLPLLRYFRQRERRR